MTATFSGLTEADVLAISARLGEPDCCGTMRLEAFKSFLDLEWPTDRDEEFRYTSPRRFDFARPVLDSAGSVPARTAGIVGSVGDSLDGLVRIADSGVVTATVCAEAAEAGVVVTDVATAAREHPDLVRGALGSAVGTERKAEALNLAAFTAGAVVLVPADVERTRPIAVTVQATAPGAIAPRVLVVLGAHAKAVVYVDHSGNPVSGSESGQADGTTVVEVVEAVLGEGPRLDLVTAQDWGQGVDHLAAHTGLVGANATYRHLEVTLGGRTVYIWPDVHLSGPGGSAELLGLYITADGQQFEHRSLIHHDANATTSELLYKGALQGDSRATWYGNIRIEEHARATASDETNRNLILTDLARADSIPFLEILNSDVVRCGHHSSVGQVDELQLFYLESRGIPREEAARMLVFAFFAEVAQRIDLPGVTEVVLAEVEREIREGPGVLLQRRR